MNCCQCEATDEHFGEERVKHELRRYRLKGPNPVTRILLEGLRAQNLQGSTLLDVGSGMGVILLELVDDGISSATLVESSSAYLKVAEAEARRLGHHESVKFAHGDFVQLAEQLPNVDVVTLNRVVCCYPYFEQLMTASSQKSRRWYALSYPRNRWFVRLGNSFENWTRSRRNDPFRTYIHPEHRIHEIMLDAGFDRKLYRGTLTWQVAIYDRSEAVERGIREPLDNKTSYTRF